MTTQAREESGCWPIPGLDTSIILKMAADDLWLRGVVTSTARSRPGRGARARAARSAACFGIKEETSSSGFWREFRVVITVFPDVSRPMRNTRAVYLLRHLHRPPADLEEQIEIAEKVRAPMRCPRAHRQVQRPCASSSPITRSRARCHGDRALAANGRPSVAHEADRNIAEQTTPDSVAKDKARRGASSRSMPNLLQHLLRGQGAERSRRRVADITSIRARFGPEEAPDEPTVITIGFEEGDPVSIDGEKLSPASMLEHLNQLGRENGIGDSIWSRTRFVGMKSRGMYETPGGTILTTAAIAPSNRITPRSRRGAPQG